VLVQQFRNHLDPLFLVALAMAGRIVRRGNPMRGERILDLMRESSMSGKKYAGNT